MCFSKASAANVRQNRLPGISWWTAFAFGKAGPPCCLLGATRIIRSSVNPARTAPWTRRREGFKTLEMIGWRASRIKQGKVVGRGMRGWRRP